VPPPAVPPPQEPSTGLLLFLPYRHLENRVFAALAAAGFDDITLAQGRIFQRIGPDGTRLTDLAELAQVTKQTAGFLVDQLERTGYVRRTPDPTDARARLVRVAERGHAALPVAQAVVMQVEAEWRAHLGPRRLRQLRQTLTALREITHSCP
jgi:DNA-binding MarR family transcriptional regulator